MVLLPKPGRAPDSPTAFRLLCLWDEAGKLLERVVAARLESHLSPRAPGLHDAQFGCRRGRSTSDAVARVSSLVERSERQGYVALAVSLDVINDFISIPCERIGRALELQRVLTCGRSPGTAVSSTPGAAEGLMRKTVCRGVPQASVLSPLLWDIAYDAVHRAPMSPDSALTCYADDTLELVWVWTWGRTVRLA
jgi:hypothetical protein